MDLSNAFDCVNRSTLWTTLYETGLPISTIQNIQQGRQGATLRCKDDGAYGAQINNSVGVFQGSALSALLFVIYLGDMTQGRQSLNDMMQLPKRYSTMAKEEVHTNQLITHIAGTTMPGDDVQKQSTSAETTTNDPAMHETQATEDGIIYADDTSMITELDAITQISRKLVNYSTATRSRDVNINWNKVEIIARKRARCANERSTAPFQPSTNGTTGKALRKAININHTSCNAINARRHKERQARQLLRRKLFTSMTLKNKTRLLLRIAIVSITLTYGIRTLELTEKDKQRLGGFAFYFLRQIRDIYIGSINRKTHNARPYI